MFANLVVDLLVTQISLGAHTCLGQKRDNLGDKVVGLGHDRGDNDLPGGQPEWQFACVLFDQDTNEALERPERGRCNM